MTKKTRNYVNKSLLTIARKCSILWCDLLEQYKSLKELHIRPKKVIRIMEIFYRDRIEAYDITIAEDEEDLTNG